ncbi:MAG: hypothetical protein IJP23_06320 [Oscillospiraceae bacterium]|nr:hypothetical protein [Oscillospiraceae bacterium]
MKRLFRKLISILLTLVLLVLSVAPAGLAVSAGTTDFGNAHIDCDPIIKYNEETGVYSLDLELNAELYDHLVNSEDNDIADRGYFSANYPGWYLVELWGGRGADILNGEEVASSGGAAGYVHAKVYLEKDDVLFYSLGGNGQETYTTGTGGGTNGGGDGGTMITYGVGGGGGYSALFLFDDPDYFESTYLNAKNEFAYDNINEYDRTTKYIMIAGGGGGAGAAPDGSRFSPDGGAGGSVLSSTVIDTVEGIGATVAGTYYSGDDGKSSGTSYDYIGHGGTNVPGEKASTSWNWVSGELPNDWVGAYNNQISPGAGGAGNLRGGAGGGGYCGGSGGIQQSIIVPNHVGGGGGGSSFVASGSNISTSLTEDEKSLLDINASKLDLSSGAVSITYLAGDGGSYSFTPLSNLTVSFAITDYFNISNFDYTQHGVDGAGEPTYENVTVSPDGDNTVFTIKNISLLPTETNLTGKVHITLDLTPKTNFLGGNDVPVLVDNSISVSGTVDEVETTKVITLDADNCHVNVPLNFSVLARDHIANGSIDLTVADMYIDRYADIRANVASNKFIDSITDYSVTGGTPALPAKVTESTEYTVSFTVTPANNTLINPVEGAGPECVTTTFTDTATVTILALHESHLNGQLINFVKALEYNNDGTYTFSLQTTAKNNRESHTPNPETAYGAGSLTFTVPHDGVYLVQAWGGTGGNGQSFKNLMGNTIKGGTGGAGGYVYVYLPLEAGDRIYTEKIGVAGVEGVQSSGTGGTGGTYSLVKLDRADSDTDELLAISGGGGGGGNAAVGKAIGLIGIEGESADGSTVIYSEPVTTGDPPEINYDAYNGHAGDPSTGSGWNIGSYEAGGKGADGVSYYNPVGKRTFGEYSFEHVTQSEFDAAVANSKPAVPAEMTNVSAGDGVVRVSCLELSDHDHVTSLLSGYTLNLQFSEYFDIIEEPSTGEPSTVVYFTGKNNCETIQGTDKETLTYTNATLSGSNLLTISNIVPHQDGSSSDGHFESSIDFTISVTCVQRQASLVEMTYRCLNTHLPAICDTARQLPRRAPPNP